MGGRGGGGGEFDMLVGVRGLSTCLGFVWSLRFQRSAEAGPLVLGMGD